MAAVTRQPFAELGSPRLHALQSAKNRQNTIAPTFTSPLKSTPTPSTGKRQRAPEIFEDADADSENVDPARHGSPSKRSKTNSNDSSASTKPARFALAPWPTQSLTATPASSTRKALSTPNTAKSTPISRTRGSPKNDRVGALSKRRASSSPFRRVDPPSFSPRAGLPFSIDAALSGTIKSYTPKPAAKVAATPASAPVQHVSAPLEDAMPKGWFFEIHEDTPEQEASNLMEHSASVLDISSDDDAAVKKINEERERGKENVPPMKSLAAPSRTAEVEEPAQRRRARKVALDAMDEDRRPLGDLVPEDFYAEGCDRESYVTVGTGIERPSGLSKECDFSAAKREEEEEEERGESENTVVRTSPAVEPREAGKEDVVDTESAVRTPVAPRKGKKVPVAKTCLDKSGTEEL